MPYGANDSECVKYYKLQGLSPYEGISEQRDLLTCVCECSYRVAKDAGDCSISRVL